jgi:hypothetical protein
MYIYICSINSCLSKLVKFYNNIKQKCTYTNGKENWEPAKHSSWVSFWYNTEDYIFVQNCVKITRKAMQYTVLRYAKWQALIPCVVKYFIWNESKCFFDNKAWSWRWQMYNAEMHNTICSFRLKICRSGQNARNLLSCCMISSSISTITVILFTILRTLHFLCMLNLLHTSSKFCIMTMLGLVDLQHHSAHNV